MPTPLRASVRSPSSDGAGSVCSRHRARVGRRAGWGAAWLVGLAGAACGPSGEAPPPGEGFVGRETCAGCHAAEVARWEGSHHDLALQPAAPETVLGDFDDVVFEHGGETTTFLRRGDEFVLRARGPNGEVRDFDVPYVLGVEPLQQVLVELPGGRLQAHPIAWDSRPVGEGGQRWYSLHPADRFGPGDSLHWTGYLQNWNSMCAECHSTGLRKGYRGAENAFETTWEEEDVSCEACHGPGAEHVAWAKRYDPDRATGAEGDRGMSVPLSRDGGAWVFDPGARIARRTAARRGRAEVETCGRCHARRSLLVETPAGAHPLFDSHRPALLDHDLYEADGQILDEVYVYGSFLQSRMYGAGVTCSDCHDPHRPRIEGDPDAVCAGCHAPAAFASPEHHFHPPDSAGASCVACHMPARTYMGVDVRRDHGFRVPRPDLSVKLGVPNTCTGCHGDRTDRWAEEVLAGRGATRLGAPHYAEALAAGRRRLPGAERELRVLAGDAAQPGIARATALDLLSQQLGPESVPVLRSALGDADPLVRAGALAATESLPEELRGALAGPLVRDPVRGVRVEAARVLAGLPPERVPAKHRVALQGALAEYRAAQGVNLERPEAHLNLGLLRLAEGDLVGARAAYETALRLAPDFVPAAVNLADLERGEGGEAEGEAVLRDVLARMPDSADAHHALGLLLVRRERAPEGLPHLRRAWEGAPRNSRYAYAYGLALFAAGRGGPAVDVLAGAHAESPGDPNLVLALATIHRDRGELAEAGAYARKLAALRPEDPAAAALLRQLDARDTAPNVR